MKLFIRERLQLPILFPAQCTFADFQIKQSIIKKISLTDLEIKEFNIREENGGLTWDFVKDLNEPILITFHDNEKQFLKQCCEALDQSLKLDDSSWKMIEKIYGEL